LRPYPKPTVVAEKLHAICLLWVADTRMKGYFDLDRVLQDEAVDASELRRAIEDTFARRKLVLPGDWPVGLETPSPATGSSRCSGRHSSGRAGWSLSRCLS